MDAFVGSLVRREIMAGLDSIYGRLGGLAITGEMWVNGSFMTQKPEPDDVDIVVYAPATFFDGGTVKQREFLNWLADDRDTVRALFSCHTAAIAEYPAGSIMHALYIATRGDYADKFGHSVVTREPKGIAVIPLNASKTKSEGGA